MQVHRNWHFIARYPRAHTLSFALILRTIAQEGYQHRSILRRVGFLDQQRQPYYGQCGHCWHSLFTEVAQTNASLRRRDFRGSSHAYSLNPCIVYKCYLLSLNDLSLRMADVIQCVSGLATQLEWITEKSSFFSTIQAGNSFIVVPVFPKKDQERGKRRFVIFLQRRFQTSVREFVLFSEH